MSQPKDSPKVCTIGGGTGTFICLSGLKKYNVQLSAIVAMTDSGGSTGKLRDQLGVLPPGDLRQALVALSESPDIWRKLFTYRFDNGDLKGHNFGNLFISSLEKITGSTMEAVDYAQRLLQTNGNVIPVTLSDSHLCALYEDGSVLEGEAQIDDNLNKAGKIKKLFLKPNADINLVAKRAIERADAIVFGPGDLHTSILPNLVITQMPDILSYTRAKKIYTVNLMTKTGQTDNYKVSDFVNELQNYIFPTKLDYIIVNSGIPDRELVDFYYKKDSSIPVVDDLGGTYENAVVIRRDLLSSYKVTQSASDTVTRSLIRHDADKLGQVLIAIIDGKI